LIKNIVPAPKVRLLESISVDRKFAQVLEYVPKEPNGYLDNDPLATPPVLLPYEYRDKQERVLGGTSTRQRSASSKPTYRQLNCDR